LSGKFAIDFKASCLSLMSQNVTLFSSRGKRRAGQKSNEPLLAAP
jgi:hypothetical protein